MRGTVIKEPRLLRYRWRHQGSGGMGHGIRIRRLRDRDRDIVVLQKPSELPTVPSVITYDLTKTAE